MYQTSSRAFHYLCCIRMGSQSPNNGRPTVLLAGARTLAKYTLALFPSGTRYLPPPL